ncbi:hypothetical protein HUU59_13490, partial [bacterium]|nr:hypothetical protein [bacterium]
MYQVIALLLATTQLCSADTLFVAPNTNIDDILHDAVPGSWIILEAGVHHGPVITYGYDFVIGSRFLLDSDTSHISETRIVPEDASADTASCIVYGYGETANSRLVGLTLSQGRGTFTDRLGDFAGGLILIQSSSAQIENCRFEDGTAYFGGACAIASPRGSISNHVVFSNCRFDSCFSSGFGGGVYADQCSVTIDDCYMSRLEAGPGAGAINMTDGRVFLSTTRIESCSGLVGGVMLGDCWGLVRACEFVSNRCYSWGVCSHFDVYSFIGRIEACEFSLATSGWPSIGIGGTSSETLFLGNLVRDNSALISSGTLVTYDLSQNEVSHNLFLNNQNVYGGTVWAFQNSNAIVHHNTFTNNSSLNPESGSVIQTMSFGRPDVSENIIAGNSGQTISAYYQYPVRIDARNNWWGHESGPYHPTLNPTGQGDTLL